MNSAVAIVRGQPDDLEVAALVAGLAAASTLAATSENNEAARPRSDRRWADRDRPLTSARRGPDEWRWSLRA